MVPGVALEKQNIKTGFLNSLRGSWSWLQDWKRPKDTMVSSGIKECKSPWRELFEEISRIDPYDYPDSPVVKCEEFNDSVHTTFQTLWSNREYNDAGWLVMATIDKLLYKNQELANSNARLQTQIKNLKVSKCVLTDNLLSFSHKAEVAETQTQSLIIRLAELQRKLNAQPRRVSEAKVRALIGKEWDPINWNGDVWEDPEEADDAEFVDANEIVLPEEENPLPPAAEESLPSSSAVLVSPNTSGDTNPVWNKQDNAVTPQDPPSAPIFASRPITRLQSHISPQGDISNVIHEETRYSIKDLLEFSNSYKQRPNEEAWEWILRVWDNGGKSIHLDQAEFVDMGPLSRNSEFNAAARRVQKGAPSLFDWLTEVWLIRWPTVNELEISDLPWFTIDEGIQRLREMGMLEWIYHLNLDPLLWDNPEDTPFTNALRNRFVRGAPASLKSSVIALLFTPDLTVGTAVTQLGNLRAMGLIGTRNARGQVAALNRHRQQKQNSGQNKLTRVDLWRWLISHGVPKSEIDGKPTKFLLDLYKRKNDRAKEQRLTPNHGNRQSRPLNQFPDLSQFTDPEPLE